MGSIKKSFFWSAVESVGPRAIQMVVAVVLARLLGPVAFGLVGMLALFMGAAQVFADGGFSASLIQRKTLTADDETSIWALNIVAGIVLAGLLCLIAPFVARFYNESILTPMLCVSSLSFVISSFGIVQGALLARNMQFHKTALVGTVSTIAAGLTGVGMASLGFGVWSLIGSTLAGSSAQLAAYWTISGWRPRGKVRFECVRSMWGFSSYLLYCNVIRVAYQNMYAAAIGKVYSAQTLGFYDRANNLRMLPVGIISNIVNRVCFPLFSQCQDNKPLLLKRIREIFRGTLFLSAGGLALLAVLADPLVPLLLSEKWRPAVPLLRILCYAGVFYPISSLYLLALQAQGHSNLNFRLESIKIVIGAIAVALVYPYGVEALAWSVVVLAVLFYFLNAYYNVKFLGYTWRLQAIDILPTLALCAISGWTSWWVGTMVPGGPVVVVAARTLLFLAICGTAIFCFRASYFDDVSKHLVWALGKLRQKTVPTSLFSA